MNGLADKCASKNGNPVYFSIQAEKNCKVNISIDTKETIEEKRAAIQKQLLEYDPIPKPRRRQSSANQSNATCTNGQEDPDHHHQYGRAYKGF